MGLCWSLSPKRRFRKKLHVEAERPLMQSSEYEFPVPPSSNKPILNPHSQAHNRPNSKYTNVIGSYLSDYQQTDDSSETQNLLGK